MRQKVIKSSGFSFNSFSDEFSDDKTNCDDGYKLLLVVLGLKFVATAVPGNLFGFWEIDFCLIGVIKVVPVMGQLLWDMTH